MTTVWRKTVLTRNLDSWRQKLTSYLTEEQIVIYEKPGNSRCRIEGYGLTSEQFKKVRKAWGGEVVRLKPSDWRDAKPFFLPLPPHFCVVSDDRAIPRRYRHLRKLVIPAGIAFGSGQHATTAMCLRQLLRHCKQSKHFLDVGTGSGILALAAHEMGHFVAAIDNDPDSIRESQANFKRNRCGGRIGWRVASIQEFSVTQSFDLITANLYADILVACMSRFRQLLKKEGTLILSGILKEQLSDVLRSAKKHSFSLVQALRKGKWCCTVFSAV